MQNCLSADNSTNWVPGWRLFHANLLTLSSLADFQLNGHQPATSCHFTQLNYWQLQQLTRSDSQSYFATGGLPPYVTSSLTRGWVCRLQLLLVLTSAVILRSEVRGTLDHILLSQIRDSPTWRSRSLYLYPPGTGWPGDTLTHWVPFSSLSTTRRATVEVFDLASTRS
jgi:hypothetical protein